MEILVWVFLQLSPYGALAWATFVAITIASVLLLRATGMFVGHLGVALAVAVFDVRWIQSEMSKPGWGGMPDQDAIFLFGVLLRIVLINIVLLPVGWMTLRLRSGSWISRRSRYEANVELE